MTSRALSPEGSGPTFSSTDFPAVPSKKLNRLLESRTSLPLTVA